jgi:hypothetical protein
MFGRVYFLVSVDFEMPVCKLYLLFFLPMLPENKKKGEKVLLPAGVLKSVAHTVLLNCNDIWQMVCEVQMNLGPHAETRLPKCQKEKASATDRALTFATERM